MKRSVRRALACAVAGVVGLTVQRAQALEVNQYSATANDRFSSGFPTAPVANTNAAFIGLNYDWSGVGWDNALATRGIALLSPGHLFGADHYFPGSGATIKFAPQSGSVISATYSGTNLDFGDGGVDLKVGTLSSPMTASAGVTYYPVLDAGIGSYNLYVGQNVLLYGRGADTSSSPRIGRNVILAVNQSNWSVGGVPAKNLATFDQNLNYQYEAKTEGGDSCSPAFIPRTNPVTGQQLLTIYGAHWTTAFTSFLPDANYFPQINAFMAQTGYAIHWMPDAIDKTWTGGGNNANWSTTTNWSSAGAPASDHYILFDGANTAANRRTITLGADRTITGMYFKSGAGADAFTFSAGNTLSIGRGGIVNYDSEPQVFNCAISAGDPADGTVVTGEYAQNWQGGSGGFTFNGAIANNGHLISIESDGAVAINAAVSGSGGLAKDGSGTLTLGASSTFTGGIFVHNGTVVLSLADAVPDGNRAHVDYGTLNLNGFTKSLGSLAGGGSSGQILIGSTNLTIGSDGTSSSYAGAIVGVGGSLSKTGAGTQTLSGSSSYSGGTAIQQGVVAISSGSALGTGTVTIGSGSNTARLELITNNFSFTNPLILSSSVVGAELVRANTSGRAFTYNGNLIQRGAVSGNPQFIRANAGTLTISGTVAGDDLAANNGYIGFANSQANTTMMVNSVISNGANAGSRMNINYGEFFSSEFATYSVTGNSSYSGGGTWSNGYQPGTHISRGTVLAGHTNALGAASSPVSIFRATGAQTSTTAALLTNASVSIPQNITVRPNNNTVAKAILGGNSNNNSSFAGSITVNDPGGGSGAGPTALALQLSQSGSGKTTFTNAITRAGTSSNLSVAILEKTGAGTIELQSASSSFTGTPVVRDGTLIVSADAPASGTTGVLGNPSGGAIQVGGYRASSALTNVVRVSTGSLGGTYTATGGANGTGLISGYSTSTSNWDGTAPSTGDRVLVLNQGDTSSSTMTPAANGIYKVTASGLEREADAVAPGSYVSVTSGSIYGGQRMFLGNIGSFTNGGSSGSLQMWLTDAGTSGSLNPKLLAGAAVTIARPITVNSSPYIGSATLGGNTDHDSTFSGNITLHREVKLTSATTGTRKVTFSGNIVDGTSAGSVRKTGSGTVSLSGANAYSGATNVDEGKLILAAPFSGATVSVASGATAELAPGGNNQLVTTGLTLTGTARLDVNDNDMIVRNGNATTLQNAVASARVDPYSPTWSGAGITSSTAKSFYDENFVDLVSVGVVLNSDFEHQVFLPRLDIFGGVAVGADDVLVKYTYVGDADLSGVVDGSDYQLIDTGYNFALTPMWVTGDFNYDSAIDGSDYQLIDTAYGLQLFGTLASAATVVPEPASLTVLAVGTALLARRRR